MQKAWEDQPSKTQQHHPSTEAATGRLQMIAPPSQINTWLFVWLQRGHSGGIAVRPFSSSFLGTGKGGGLPALVAGAPQFMIGDVVS
jgi:hypothetical protein